MKEMKVIPSKGVASQHRIIVPDVTVKPCREEKQLLEKMKVNTSGNGGGIRHDSLQYPN